MFAKRADCSSVSGRLVPWALALVFLLSALRLFHLIDQYAVNILFWDQWDFYDPLFRNASLWDMFNYRHGPHRQGLGYFLIKWVAGISRWDSRADIFSIAVVMCVA